MSNEIEFPTLPDLGQLYVKAAFRRRQKPAPKTPKPQLSAHVDNVTVDAETLRAYRQICAIVDDGCLPPSYPQVLATPLHGAIVAHRDFPLPAMGLVHLQNQIEQVRPIEDGESFDLRCAVSGWEWDERLGMRFAIETTLSVDGKVVWRSELWALSRGDRSDLVKRERKHREPPPLGEEPDALFSVIVDAPADLGRRYASICKDYNPIHLHPLTAKPFGFKRPIIHGMWTMARCWAELANFAPGDNLGFSVRFKKPLYLPSKVWISGVESDEGILYKCRNLEGDRLFLEGLVK